MARLRLVGASKSAAPRPVYGLDGGAVADDAPRMPSNLVPLLLLVVALAAATVWLAVLPALRETPVTRSCEVVFLPSGKTTCVEASTIGPRAVVAKSKHPARPKR
jgi:hypothetical protein